MKLLARTIMPLISLVLGLLTTLGILFDADQVRGVDKILVQAVDGNLFIIGFVFVNAVVITLILNRA